MPKLTAKFSINDLARYVGHILGVGEPRSRTFYGVVDRFDVTLTIMASGTVPTFTPGSGGPAQFYFNAACADIAGQEALAPPADTFQRSSYFAAIIQEYQRAALTALSRFVRFCKYELRQPLLREVNTLEIWASPSIWSPRWSVERADGVETFTDQALGRPLYFAPEFERLVRFSWGMQGLDPSAQVSVDRHLSSDVGVSLYQRILSDAQSAAALEETRRAVLELAVACEVAVKQAFFEPGSMASAAFDYMEDRQRTTIKVVELVDGAARAAFGESFKEAQPMHYTNLDHLFRARNKIAHRGRAEFRDDAATLRTVTQETLRQWWLSVDALVDWLKQRSAP